MLRKNVPSFALLHLLDPAGGDGGAAVVEQADPTGLSGWMGAIGKLEGSGESTTPAQLKKENDDGNSNEGSGGGDAAGTRPNADAVASGSGDGASKLPDGKNADAAKAEADAAAAAATAAAAKAKEGEKKDEKKDAEGEGEDKWPRSGNDWDKFKAKRAAEKQALQAEIKTRDTKLQEYETRFKELESKSAKSGEEVPEVKAKIDRLTKENEELSQRIQVLDVTMHPKFQAHFKGAVDAQINRVKAIAGDELGAKFEKAITLPDGPLRNSEIETLMSDLPVLAQARIGNVLENLEAIAIEKQEAINNAGQLKGKLAEQEAGKQKATREGFEKIWSQLSKEVQDAKEGNPLYVRREGDDKWNAGVEERIAATKRLLSGTGVKPEEVVKAAFHAVAMPAVLQMHVDYKKETDAELASLRAQVQKLTAVQPKPGGTGATDPNVEQGRPEVRTGMSPMEAASSFVKSLGSLR